MSREDELEQEVRDLKEERRRTDDDWRREISRKLDASTEYVRTCMTNTQALLTQVSADNIVLKKEMSDVKVTLYGGGSDNEPGLKLKVDRLQGRVALMWLPVTAAFTAAGAWAWSKLTGGKP